jgi:hypothetical protein
MIDPARELAQHSELYEAARDAHRRVSIGLAVTLNADTFDWAEGPGHDTVPCHARIEHGYKAKSGDLCTRYAGAGTTHRGVGRCWQHGGNGEAGIREAAWIVGHAFARELECSPWEGLLRAVKIAAGRSAFCESKLATATCDEDLMPDGPLWHWVKQAAEWHEKLAKMSSLAISAGVAERLVRQLELEATLMIRATRLTLAELGLSDEQTEHALGIMSRNLLALEAEEVGVEVREIEK